MFVTSFNDGLIMFNTYEIIYDLTISLYVLTDNRLTWNNEKLHNE